MELNIIGGTIQEVAPQMLAGLLDLALVVHPFNSPGLEKIVLFEKSFAGFLSADHPLANKLRLQIRDLASERFILPRQGQNTRKLIDRYFNERGISRLFHAFSPR